MFQVNWIEVPACGIFCLDISQKELSDISLTSDLILYPWLQKTNSQSVGVYDLSSSDTWVRRAYYGDEASQELVNVNFGPYGLVPGLEPLNSHVPGQELEPVSEDGDISQVACREMQELAGQLLQVLGEAVRVRVQAQSNLCSQCIKNRILAATKLSQAPELSAHRDNITWTDRKNNVNDSHNIAATNNISTCREDSRLADVVNGDKDGHLPCGHCRVAVLYSGGIDSLVIAALADRFVGYPSKLET